MQVDQEETNMAAWVEQQATEASNQLEYVSLQELIVWSPGLDGGGNEASP